jgi:hypothetical protein
MTRLSPLLALCAALLSGAAPAQDEAPADGAPGARAPAAEPPPDPELLGVLADLGEAAGDGSMLGLFDLLLDATPLGAGVPADGAGEDGP